MQVHLYLRDDEPTHRIALKIKESSKIWCLFVQAFRQLHVSSLQHTFSKFLKEAQEEVIGLRVPQINGPMISKSCVRSLSQWPLQVGKYTAKDIFQLDLETTDLKSVRTASNVVVALMVAVMAGNCSA